MPDPPALVALAIEQRKHGTMHPSMPDYDVLCETIFDVFTPRRYFVFTAHEAGPSGQHTHDAMSGCGREYHLIP
eukprot:3640981-Prymnesium_polylepis.2